jgi:hypothetical protein
MTDAKHAAEDPLDTPAEWLIWLKAAGIRAVKTAAQAALGAIGAAAALGDANWILVGSTAGLAAVASVLTSIVGLPEVADGDSLAKLTSK